MIVCAFLIVARGCKAAFTEPRVSGRLVLVAYVLVAETAAHPTPAAVGTRTAMYTRNESINSTSCNR
jgi:hypothetical protein